RAVTGDDVTRPGARGVGQSADQDVRRTDVDAEIGVGPGQLAGAVGADVVALDDHAVGHRISNDAEAEVAGDDVTGRGRGAADDDVVRVDDVDTVGVVAQRGGAVGAQADGVALDEGAGGGGAVERPVAEFDAVPDDVARPGRRAADGIAGGRDGD